MKTKLKVIIPVFILSFILFLGWRVDQIRAKSYCTAPCGGTACPTAADPEVCTSEPLDCTQETYFECRVRLCEPSGGCEEEDKYGRCIKFAQHCWCDLYEEIPVSQCEADNVEKSCPSESGCCTTICDPETGEPDPASGGGGGGGSESVSGTVYLMESGGVSSLVGGFCSLTSGSANPGEPGAGSTVTVYGSDENVDDVGGWQVSGLAEATGYTAMLSVGDANSWVCKCPDGCAYGGVSAPGSGYDFFVSPDRLSWFQVQGGSLHANLGGVTSNIPSTCEADLTCNENLIVKGANNEVGLVSYSLGGIDLGDMGENQIAEGSEDWQAATSFKGTQTGYSYFSRILTEDPEEFEAWDGSEPVATGVFLSDGTAETSGGDWSIASGEAAVILVPGNVTIKNNISVAEGGFLAIISSGSISIADGVTDVEGVFIADGFFNTCESDTCGDISGGGTVAEAQLNLEGIFVGWGGVDLRRDFNTGDNNTNPAEVFVYRPDLQANAYAYLMRPYYSWQEVNP